MNLKAVLLLSGLIAGTVGISNATQITLDPSLLPSSQGWTYGASGVNPGTVEADLYSASGSVLTMNSLGQPFSHTGSGATTTYRQYDVVNSSIPATLTWTSRTLEYEHASHSHSNFGFSLGFSDGSLQYGVGISLTQVEIINGANRLSIALDTTEYHTYRIETVGSTAAYNFYIDDTWQTSASARSIILPNYISLGDGTTTANAKAEITALEFTQIPEPGTMGLIGIFAGGAVLVRRLFPAA